MPVVVHQAPALNAFGGDALFQPEIGGLVVVEVDGDPHLLRIEAEAALALRARDQIPSEGDSALLEVVREGEVPAHLKEGAVPGGLADLLDVQSAHAFLDADRPLEGRGLLAGEIGLERHHAGVDEQQGGVVVQQRGRSYLGVSASDEKVEKELSDVSGLHGQVSL